MSGVTSLILRVQADQANCPSAVWDPVPVDTSGEDWCGNISLRRPKYVQGLPAPTELLNKTPGPVIMVNNIPIATEGTVHGLTDATTVTRSGNAIIHWHPNAKPHDGANCWLRNAEAGRWAAE